MEFVESLKKQMIGPLQEKIDALYEGFEQIGNLIMKFPLVYDNKLDELTRRVSLIEQKLNSYEIQFNKLNSDSHTSMQPKPPPPPPPNLSQIEKKENPRIENKAPPRQLIINELKEIFRMREGKKKGSDPKS